MPNERFGGQKDEWKIVSDEGMGPEQLEEDSKGTDCSPRRQGRQHKYNQNSSMLLCGYPHTDSRVFKEKAKDSE